MQTRRKLITGLISLVAAPAIIRVNHLMPISVQLKSFKYIVDIESYSLDDPLPYDRNVLIVGRHFYDAYKQALKEGSTILPYDVKLDTST